MSPYYPPDYDEPTHYYCPNCKATYAVPRVTVSCLVLHQPGSCCHYGERRIDGDDLRDPITPEQLAEWGRTLTGGDTSQMVDG